MLYSANSKGRLLLWFSVVLIACSPRASAHENTHCISFSVVNSSVEEAAEELKMMAGCYFNYKKHLLDLGDATFKMEGSVLCEGNKSLFNTSVTTDTMDLDRAVAAMSPVLVDKMNKSNASTQARLNLEVCASSAKIDPTASPAAHPAENNFPWQYIHALAIWGMLYLLCRLAQPYLEKIQSSTHQLNERLGTWAYVIWVLQLIYRFYEIWQWMFNNH